MERKIKLHSPMVKTLKVLEEGFVNRGKKKGKRIKRAKLYYLRDLGLEGEFRSFFMLVSGESLRGGWILWCDRRSALGFSCCIVLSLTPRILRRSRNIYESNTRDQSG